MNSHKPKKQNFVEINGIKYNVIQRFQIILPEKNNDVFQHVVFAKDENNKACIIDYSDQSPVITNVENLNRKLEKCNDDVTKIIVDYY